MATRARKLVVAALIVDGDKVLLTQRRADQAMPLQWELPGGKVEAGESPEAALARELDEEIGVRARAFRIHDVVFHAYDDFDLYMLVYATAIEGTPAPVAVAAVEWVERARLPSIDLLPADRPLARRLAEEKP